MTRFVVRRVLASIPVLLLATMIVFTLVSLRGDPLQRYRHNPKVSQQTLQNLEHKYHLDKSKPEQYMLWLGDFAEGKWGRSFSSDQPVQTIVRSAAINTFELVFVSVLFSISLALLIGVVSAVRQYSLFDHGATGLSYFGYSMPDFVFGLVLQLVAIVWLQEALGVHLVYVYGKYSVGQEGNLLNLTQHMVLPVLTLSLTGIAAWSRFQRDSMLDVINTDYVRTARAKGVPRRTVVTKHAMRNALIPFITVVAVDTGALLGGVVVVEEIFGWRGLGSVFLAALRNFDYPVLLAVTLLSTTFVIVLNLVADVLYGFLDPRIRVS